ncbi:hypothetical protein D3C80_1743170 [compost metagenome]
MVIPPMIISEYVQIGFPPKIGEKRASRYIPAFTMVAECKYADTGVGAFIAPGNQKWKGNCADFVMAPSATNPKISGKSGCC